MTRKTTALVLLLVAAAATTSMLLPSRSESHEGDPLPEPRVFDWEAFLPPAAPEGKNWARTARREAHHVFDRLRRAIVTNTIEPDAIVAFEKVIDEPARLARIRTLLGALEGEGRTDAVRRLYAELMLADSNPDVLFGQIREETTRSFENIEEDPRNTGRSLGWAMSIPNLASLMAFETTGQVRFLEHLSETIDRTLALRDSELGRVDEVRGRTMQGWGAERYDPDSRFINYVTLSGRICFTMLMFCEVVRDHPELQPRFGDQAARCLEAARLCLDEFDEHFRVVEGGDEGYYVYVPKNDVEPVNHMAWAGNALILLHELTGEQKYGRMARQLAAFVRASMWTDERGCLVWTYWPRPERRRSRDLEYVWKARTTTQFALFAYRRGIVFTRADMEAIADTFLINVHRGHGRFSARIDGVFENLEAWEGFRGGHLCLTPFIVFDEFRPGVRDVIEEMVSTRPDAGGWMRRGHGLVAYAYRLKRVPAVPAG